MPARSNYDALLLEMKPRPIRSQRTLERAYKLIDKLMSTDHLSQAESDMLEMLSMLVEQFESREHPTPSLSPLEMLAHLIEAKGVKNADLARVASIPRSTLTDILAGRRGISKSNVTRLADYFGVSPDVFLEPSQPVQR